MGTAPRRRFEYESSDSSREEMKRKFAHTMEFVEEYLRDVVSQPYPFGDKDKNELTLEVWKNELDAFTLLSPSLLKAFRTLPSSLGGESSTQPGLLWVLQLQRAPASDAHPAGHSGYCPAPAHLHAQAEQEPRGWSVQCLTRTNDNNEG